MKAALLLWLNANKVKLLEYGAMIVLVLAIFFAIWFSMHQRQELAEALGRQQAEMAAITEKLAASEAARDAERRDYQNVLQNSQKLSEDLATIRDEIAKRQETITKHDLGKIGAAKPNLLESRINKATRDQFKRIEEATRP
jgi:uncharacterized protein YlxW (UPF0749 family)